MTNTKSAIQWTDVTWSPVVGCTRVSAGCDHCYAFQLHDQRHLAWKRGRWATAPGQYRQPFSKVRQIEERLDEPYHWRKPRRVFVNSMSDLFHDQVRDAFLYGVWTTMRDNPQHTFQILTKRPARMLDWMTKLTNVTSAMPWDGQATLPNVWLGVSVEDQAAADERIPLLLQTPAAVRFISAEPLLGPVDLCNVRYDDMVAINALTGEYGFPTPHAESDRRLHWVIIGGESGPHARPMELEWAFGLKAQCEAAGVPVFVKQLGSVYAKQHGWRDRHGGNPAEWPYPLMTTLYKREWPTTQTVG